LPLEFILITDAEAADFEEAETEAQPKKCSFRFYLFFKELKLNRTALL